jgi:O-antigen ligase
LNLKRGFAAPFLFLALAAAAFGSVHASPILWAAALLLVVAAARVVPAQVPDPGTSHSTIAFVFFALWIAATNQFANPSYTAAAPFHAAFLLGGFILGRRAGVENARTVFLAAFAFALSLVVWTSWQVSQGEARAHALFETPATLSAAINLVLLPALACFLWARRPAWLGVALVMLVAALSAANSRGGWLAFGAGAAATLIFARRMGLPTGARTLLPVIAVVAGGFTIGQLPPLATQLVATMATGAAVAPLSLFAEGAATSSVARLELYRAAIQALGDSSWLWGSGYLSFYYRLQQGRAAIVGYEDSVTYFVHDDYLQTLLELGVPGLLGLFALVLVPLSVAWRAAPRMGRDSRAQWICAGAFSALVATAAHAAVDYPFYVPVCLLLYGAAAGVLDSVLLSAGATPGMRIAGGLGTAMQRRLAGIGVAALWLWALLVPMAAEAAAGYAQTRWRAADAERAAYWFEAARRIAPSDWRYHWYAGQFWLAVAAGNSNRGAAALAAGAFAAGDAANPREVRNLLGLIATHLRLRSILPAPADPGTLREWTDRALALAPLDQEVREQRALLNQRGQLASERQK